MKRSRRIKLGVNIDHVATLREARKIDIPDPLEAALICEEAGADSIVCHLREDRRHIHDKDLYRLKKVIKKKLNLEMSTSKEIVNIACNVKPDQATLVPERREELTTEGGLNVIERFSRIKRVVKQLTNSGINVSLFIDPDLEQISATLDTGVGMVELHTGCYANAKIQKIKLRKLRQLATAAEFGKKLGLKIFAGHGLNYKNVKSVSKIPEIEELNIGHSIIARSVFVGIDKAVREMKDLIS